MQWRLAAVRYTRQTPTGTTEDKAQFGLHLVKIDLGQIVTSWATADYTAAETALNPLFAALLPLTHTTHTITEFRWYLRAFNAALPMGTDVTTKVGDPPKVYDRFARSGPPQRVTPVTSAGSATGNSPSYQSAMSVTFKTPGPKHWGRVYLPGIGPTVMSGTDMGRWASTALTTVANAFFAVTTSLAASKLYLVVPATQQGGKFATALNVVTGIQVDDIPDVIRRRRPKQAKTRTQGQ